MTDNESATVTAAPVEKDEEGKSSVDPAVTECAQQGRRRPATTLALVAAVATAVALTAAWFWHSTAIDLDALRQQNADSARAAELARDYTLRSLTYDHRDVEAFFDAVRRDASDQLAQRYNEIHDTLSSIMTEAQVVATGEVVATAVEPAGNNQYTVTVFAKQRTQNIQNPEPVTAPNLLSVTVAKQGDTWKVADYGPRG
ncbi:hypothetical protein [Nocardia farcinica]|uniref:hypothetical protein n=1 Tax=Nocardia farcinica TaxID=37329 RepID=UPI0015F1201F|nr:hypothetical protein [Nocardia farcinica]MBA4859193.1 hypothetical protein [Nocardia farcinica]MBC9819025.1 hypothetical protein [Nocardia farcinica]